MQIYLIKKLNLSDNTFLNILYYLGKFLRMVNKRGLCIKLVTVLVHGLKREAFHMGTRLVFSFQAMHLCTPLPIFCTPWVCPDRTPIHDMIYLSISYQRIGLLPFLKWPYILERVH